MNILLFVGIFWIVPMFVAHAIGKGKRRSGFWYGLLLGWLGVLILALLAPLPEPSPEKELELLERRKRAGYINKNAYAEERAQIEAKMEQEVATLSRECPFCKEAMRRDASVCPHCQRDSEPWKFHEGHWWDKRDGVWFWRNEATGEWTRAASDAATEALSTPG